MNGVTRALRSWWSKCAVANTSIVVLLVLGVLLASCGTQVLPPASSSTVPSARTGVVFGVVSAGPTCPVERKGHPCPPQLLADVLVEAEHSGGGVVAETRTTRKGAFSLALPRGRYYLVVKSSGFLPRCPAAVATVREGKRRHLDIACDTGIR